jgi:hypothetical protein
MTSLIATSKEGTKRSQRGAADRCRQRRIGGLQAEPAGAHDHHMKQALSALALVAGLATALAVTSRGAAQDDDAPPGDVPSCIEHRGEARYRGLGYDHVVVIRSTCDRAAQCRVSTNVNPQVQRVRVPSGETVEVVTYRGSPAREFTPRVACTLD